MGGEGVELGSDYEGAKPSAVITVAPFENTDWITELVIITYAALPRFKRRKERDSGCTCCSGFFTDVYPADVGSDISGEQFIERIY